MRAPALTSGRGRAIATALAALINVLVFGVKQLLNTIIYRRQLLIIKTKPRISYSVKLAEAPAAARSPSMRTG